MHGPDYEGLDGVCRIGDQDPGGADNEGKHLPTRASVTPRIGCEQTMSKVRRPDSISLLALARCFEKLVAKITSAFPGIILFSVCCVVMGFAQEFWQLVVLRVGIALGEAVCRPAASSLIAEKFRCGHKTWIGAK